jgi:hypothetical protein
VRVDSRGIGNLEGLLLLDLIGSIIDNIVVYGSMCDRIREVSVNDLLGFTSRLVVGIIIVAINSI